MTYYTLFQDNISNFQSANHSSKLQILQANLLQIYRNFFDNFFALNPGEADVCINALMRKHLSMFTLLKEEEYGLNNVGKFLAGAIRANLLAPHKTKYIEEDNKKPLSFNCNVCGASFFLSELYKHIINCTEQLTNEIVPVKHGNTLFCLYNKELELLLTKRNLTEEALLNTFHLLVKKIMDGSCKKVCSKTECLEHKGWRIECLGTIVKNIVKNEKKVTRSNMQLGFNTNNYHETQKFV
eukprot:GAHX01002858.1.p1 GENE.GAHX01002858.1~~GAHX01002858.1.p1  ORF type:complete len:240 (-),score=38.50 GAHX01002858.1:221-940(-)